MKRTALLAAAVLCASALQAKVTLPSVISDNMVLQQNTNAALWGKAEPGRTVTVKTSWNKRKYSVKADPQTGAWFVDVATTAAGGPYEISISDGDKLVLQNVLLGEVWFASGQSNMEMPVGGYGSQPARDGTEYIIRAKPSRDIRICKIARQSSTTPADTTKGSWQLHEPNAVAWTSATAYFFAEALQGAIDVPVGIIVSSWGGSSIETWLSREVMESEFPDVSLAHLDGTAPVKKPSQDPCMLYNGQVAPLVPYTFRGMIWYQGCTNRPQPDRYIRYQEAYARMMRKLFRVPDAPFYFVQIAPYPYDNGRKWHNGYFNEAQQKSLDLIPHSGMAVTCDVGEYGTIHPCRKREVGTRLALLALQNDYGIKGICATAPTYKAVQFADGKAVVEFNVDGQGLSPMGADISGFEIAGEDKVFHPAVARLHKNRFVVVSSPDVPVPVAVRYCFRNWCVGGLYNNYGVPAAPFRTDGWSVDEVPL